MQEGFQSTVAERLMRYVQIDTQSDPHSPACPSTEKQKDLARLLVKELQELGIRDAEMDAHGYVYATIPATSDKSVPVLCFCAHMDTSPDCSGAGVRPILHRSYDGADIILPDDPSQVISPRVHPYLMEKKGEDLITASGTTLLGADDKAGIAVIMNLAQHLMQHPEIPHGRIRLLFTPDEEIGRGVDKVDLQRLGADFAYTLDGGRRGSYEDETFSADAATIRVQGISSHPGDAKGKMVHAGKIIADLIAGLPREGFSPESTSDREGFIHPVSLHGTVEEAGVEFILRDFHTFKLAHYAGFLRDRMDGLMIAYPGARYTLEVREQYRNMKDVLDAHPQIRDYAFEAMRRAGVEPLPSSARGGTDGSRLSFMGLPCPNLFTGEMAFHGKQEYVSVQDMEKSVETLIHLVQVWEAKS